MRRGSLNSLFQVALHLPSYVPTVLPTVGPVHYSLPGYSRSLPARLSRHTQAQEASLTKRVPCVWVWRDRRAGTRFYKKKRTWERNPFVERLRQLLAAFRSEVFKFPSFHLYQKCLFKTFYGLYNILEVSKTSKLQLQTRPTFTAIALVRCILALLEFFSSPQNEEMRSQRFVKS